jgi:hypothetical protein
MPLSIYPPLDKLERGGVSLPAGTTSFPLLAGLEQGHAAPFAELFAFFKKVQRGHGALPNLLNIYLQKPSLSDRLTANPLPTTTRSYTSAEPPVRLLTTSLTNDMSKLWREMGRSNNSKQLTQETRDTDSRQRLRDGGTLYSFLLFIVMHTPQNERHPEPPPARNDEWWVGRGSARPQGVCKSLVFGEWAPRRLAPGSNFQVGGVEAEAHQGGLSTPAKMPTGHQGTRFPLSWWVSVKAEGVCLGEGEPKLRDCCRPAVRWRRGTNQLNRGHFEIEDCPRFAISETWNLENVLRAQQLLREACRHLDFTLLFPTPALDARCNREARLDGIPNANFWSLTGPTYGGPGEPTTQSN